MEGSATSSGSRAARDSSVDSLERKGRSHWLNVSDVSARRFRALELGRAVAPTHTEFEVGRADGLLQAQGQCVAAGLEVALQFFTAVPHASDRTDQQWVTGFSPNTCVFGDPAPVSVPPTMMSRPAPSRCPWRIPQRNEVVAKDRDVDAVRVGEHRAIAERDAGDEGPRQRPGEGDVLRPEVLLEADSDRGRPGRRERGLAGDEGAAPLHRLKPAASRPARSAAGAAPGAPISSAVSAKVGQTEAGRCHEEVRDQPGAR